MGDQDKGHAQNGRFYRVTRERLEILLHVTGIALQMSYRRGSQILQAPTGNHRIES